MEHTLWHLFSSRTKAAAFFSASTTGSTSLMHGNIALKSNNLTRRMSMLSKGGCSRSDENIVESVEKNGTTEEDGKDRDLWCPTPTWGPASKAESFPR